MAVNNPTSGGHLCLLLCCCPSPHQGLRLTPAPSAPPAASQQHQGGPTGPVMKTTTGKTITATCTITVVSTATPCTGLKALASSVSTTSSLSAASGRPDRSCSENHKRKGGRELSCPQHVPQLQCETREGDRHKSARHPSRKGQYANGPTPAAPPAASQ